MVYYQWEFFIYRDDVFCYNNVELIYFFEWIPTETGAYTLITNVTDESGFTVSYTKQFIIS